MRIKELKNSINQYENDISVLRDRITKFEGLRNNKKLKRKSIEQNIKNMKHNSVRCDNCKINIHRASYSGHLKSKKLLEKIQQNTVNTPRKEPMKTVVKEVIKVTDTNVENQYHFTDKILTAAFDIIINNHHDKHANSQKTITSNFK